MIVNDYSIPLFASPFLSCNFDEKTILFQFLFIIRAPSRSHVPSEITDESSDGLSNFSGNYECDSISAYWITFCAFESADRSINKIVYFSFKFSITPNCRLPIQTVKVNIDIIVRLALYFFLLVHCYCRKSQLECIYTNRKYKVGKWINSTNTPNTNNP